MIDIFDTRISYYPFAQFASVTYIPLDHVFE